jgi:O-antigen/teichoic acid export membrane protein
MEVFDEYSNRQVTRSITVYGENVCTMRTKNAFYNFIASIVLQLTVAIIGVILPPIRIKTYGSEINGLIASLQQFVSYFYLVSAGVGTAATQALYKPLADKDYNQINSILRAIQNFYYRSGIAFICLILILSGLYPCITKANLPNYLVIPMVLVIGGGGIIEYFFYNKYTILLTADQKNYVLTIIQISASILNAIVAVVLMLSGKNIIIVQICYLGIYLLRIFAIIAFFKRNYPEVNLSVQPDYMAINKRWDAFVHEISSMVLSNTDIIVITIFCGLKQVSIYSIYNVVFLALGAIIGAFSSGLTAGFGQIISHGNKEVLHKSYNSFESLYYMVIAWIYTCTAILIIPFERIYTQGIHDANYIDPLLAFMFIMVGVANNIRIPQCILVNAAGHYRETRWKAILEASINLITSVIFVQYIGIYGVLTGTLCSFAYRTIDFIWYGNRRILGQSPIRSIRRILLNSVLSGIILLLFRILPINTEGWSSWFLNAIKVAGVSLIVIFSGNYIFENGAIKDIMLRVKLIFKNSVNSRKKVSGTDNYS